MQLGIIKTSHIASLEQPADLFTKALSSSQLTHLLSKLGVCNLFQTSNLMGDVTDINEESQ